MKKFKNVLFFSLLSFLLLSSFTLIRKNYQTGLNSPYERVSFRVKGTGSKGISVKIGIGHKVGSGSCCSTVGPQSSTSFTANVGDVMYDSEKNRVIVKVYSELNGTTIDLKDYY